MDNEQERNEHFKGFAELLLNDLKPDMAALFIALGSPLLSRDEEIEKAQRFLMLKVAQRAYDLVQHALKSIEDYEHGMCYESDLLPGARFDHVPDLTEWPTQQQP